MAQLTDDCFAFSGPLLPLAEMNKLIGERIKPVAETESTSLGEAHGRVTATDVRAPVALPPFDNSAVDGYAVRFADLKANGDTVMPVAGRLMAGQAATADIAAGTAVRIFTGAPMPRDADTVFMQEDVREEAGSVVLPSGLKQGANRRLAGEDVAQGSVVIPAGTMLGPQHIALAAALGLTTLDVHRRLKVAIFSTGNEVVEPGAVRSAAAIFDSNRYLVAELLRRLGVAVTDLGILRDDEKTLAAALKDAAAKHDLVLTTGGVSTGEADYVKNAVETIGTLVFWRVGIKPGRPVSMGIIDGAAFVGLPGNPVAVFVTFVLVVRPLLLRLAGAKPEKISPLPVRVGFSYRKKKDRREYVRVSLQRRPDGEIEAIKHPQDGAGILTSLTETDGLLEFVEDVTEVKPGDRAGFLSYASLIG